MALSARHRWCAGKIVECFGGSVDEARAQAFIRQEENHQRFQALFKGDAGGPTRLFVYFQPLSALATVASASAQPAAPTAAGGPEPVTAAAGGRGLGGAAAEGAMSPPELFLTEGESDGEPLLGKCCFFIRNAPSGQPIDVSKEGEADLLFGEVDANALQALEGVLSHCYKPLFEAAEPAVWGKAEEGNKVDFLGEVDHLVHSLGEALKSLAGGLELRKPDARMMQELDTAVLALMTSRTKAAAAAAGGSKGCSALVSAAIGPQHRELFRHFEQLLEEWCGQIEAYLEGGGKPGDGAGDAAKGGSAPKRGGGAAAAVAVVGDEGPKGELEYWRSRMQRLTSITEQLRRKDVNQVIALLSSSSSSFPASAPQPASHSTASASTAAADGEGGAGKQQQHQQQRLGELLRQWKQLDVDITEAANEAKDNVKYLFTLERFIEPLYSGTPSTMIDTLPALMNSLKMIHTIARYYGTAPRMTALLGKMSDQMVRSCKSWLLAGGPVDALWEREPQELVRQLEACIKLFQAYQEQYRLAQAKLQQMPKGKQFDFLEPAIFGRFDLFVARALKLIELFTTLDQFLALSHNRLEGMEGIIAQFHAIVKDFRSKRHDLLDQHNGKFDRDYGDFNCRIAELEAALQGFINQSFENITSIEPSLQLLRRFQAVLQRESLKSDLDSKLTVIFQNYGMELEQVQQLYEKQMNDPPLPRNMPPVAGNIAWARHLYKRIEAPMKQFERNQNVLAGKEAKKIIRMYNKIARTLVEFEFRWQAAWEQSVERAKAGLHATLLVRHPDDGRLYVNLDQEIPQLIREAKSLDRMGIEVPEAAKMVLFQEEKLKGYYHDLRWLLDEYHRVVTRVIPVTAAALRPHFKDLELRLRPGLTTLTWTSMNIDAYVAQARSALGRLDALVATVNDVVENRVEKALKAVSRTVLADLPAGQSLTVEEFVRLQERHIAVQSTLLQTKNVEVQHAVDDLIRAVTAYALDPRVGRVPDEELLRLRRHYNHFMFQALLHCAKNSMDALKKRIAPGRAQLPTAAAASASQPPSIQPFFEVNVHLTAPSVVLQPPLDAIQACINQSAQAILRCFTKVYDWNIGPSSSNPAADGQAPTTAASIAVGAAAAGGAAPAASSGSSGSSIFAPDGPTVATAVHNGAPATFFERITRDIEIVRVALLLTGCVQGIRNTVQEYLSSFGAYDWLWRDNKDLFYQGFVTTGPSVDAYKERLEAFDAVEDEIEAITPLHAIGALLLNTSSLKASLKGECNQWKLRFAVNLHARAKDEMERLTEYIRVTMSKLTTRDVTDLDTLRHMMLLLREVRSREAGMEKEMDPVLGMYAMLEAFLPPGSMEKEEVDKITVLRSSWKRLLKQAETRTDELTRKQAGFKRGLIRDVRAFVDDVKTFRADFLRSGPMVQGIDPASAVERLKRFKEEYRIRERKNNLYQVGEEIFGLPVTEYPDLRATERELKLLDQLYGLYTEVLDTIRDWSRMGWVNEMAPLLPEMAEKMEAFSARSKKLPTRLRDWEAYKQLRQKIEDYQTLLPLLQELSKESIKKRHWEEVAAICNVPTTNALAAAAAASAGGASSSSSAAKPPATPTMAKAASITASSAAPLSPPQQQLMRQDSEILTITEDFPAATPLGDVLKWGLLAHKEEVEDVCDAADKQRKIERELREIAGQWQQAVFMFQEWKQRGVMVLKGTVGVMEALEESQMRLQQMLTQRHVAPFKAEAQERLTSLSDTADTLERWIKVQLMWCSLESVFMSGDIAKQMPAEAKKFAKIDKDWGKMMATSHATARVVETASNEGLRAMLPVMHAELEKCQKSLEGYLEQKRNKFPRFFFVSNPGLLTILSQGSDPLSMNEHYKKVFDALESVEHSKRDKTVIEAMYGDEQRVLFSQPVRAVGNIEDWLADLLKRMQLTMKDLCRACAIDVAAVGNDIAGGGLRRFVDAHIAQFALLGIQLLWTMDCQTALEQCRAKRNIVKETSAKQLAVLQEMSSWCLQDLGSKSNRRKIETLVTIHVHQRDVMADLAALHRQKRISDANDFEWLKQARFYWRPNAGDECDPDGACVVSITDVDFNYQYEYLGSKERLVVTPLTDRCYITLAQALGMYFGGAPAGPAGTGKTETVKDLGRTLGLFVVVTNCTDQQKYTDCAKIFKGLCQGGLWGCFDEFNRILLPVLSVVAQQVLAIQNAKKAGLEYFQFPGDPQQVLLKPCCGFFITMNPGYAGRQELPENLKALFRGVAMMTPDFQIIKKVKLCSVGYADFDLMAQKFYVLYATCKEQLSAQKHYDWGLRNILAVLRTAGQTKRDNGDKSEAFLIYRTLRDMNLSKLVAQDVPLFLSLLADLFPTVPPPPKGDYPEVEALLAQHVEKEKLVYHPGWVNKVIQLYETTRVRHGVMLVGAAGGGKTTIIESLAAVLSEHTGKAHRIARFNPKALRAPEMYGEVDPLSGEWTTGVFAAMWAKFNNKANSYNTWILADGPVDAIWIEDLNTVLDDNKLLTLANGDRIPMTDNVKLMFEVETLVNASPATVSRAGIIYVSDTDLDWAPVLEAWIRRRPPPQQALLRQLQAKWLGDNTPTDPGHCFDFLARNTRTVLPAPRVGLVASLCDLFAGLTDPEQGGVDLAALYSQEFAQHPSASAAAAMDAGGEGGAEGSSSDSNGGPFVLPGGKFASAVERLFLYCLCWSVGALLEQEDRVRFDRWLRERDTNKLLPPIAATANASSDEVETIYEYYVHAQSLGWERWRPPTWTYPAPVLASAPDRLDFSNLLVPTMDSTRAGFLLQKLHSRRKPVLLMGAEGTAKTSTALMFLRTLGADTHAVKRINFSSATSPFMCQNAVEAELDKRGGRSFGPPGGKRMTVFIDDLSMPEKNKWGDQPTLEMVRLLVEHGGFPFLDKDKRGEFKVCEDLQYLAAMGHPGSGRNDIPNRLKRNFAMINLVSPSMTSINDIYGQMLRGRFPTAEFSADVTGVVSQLTRATIALWRTMKEKMLPTPAKFHYTFNLRELSRVFQGVLLTPKETILSGGGLRARQGLLSLTPGQTLLGVWRHECERVFSDKLTNDRDKDMYGRFMGDVLAQYFPEYTPSPTAAPASPEASAAEEQQEQQQPSSSFPLLALPSDFQMVSFLRDDVLDDDGALVEEAPKLYECGGSLAEVRDRVEALATRYNEEFPAKRMDLVFFDDALRHLLRISRLLETPRGSALLVGVGGSGKQSLTRLAAYMARTTCFQITLTKGYNLNAFLDDLRALYKSAGQQRKPTTFLFTESEIKDEVFLELLNSILLTGEVPGLFAKEEYMAMAADLRLAFLKERPGMEETPENLKQFFIDCVRDNLHLVICMSPLNPKFPVRARKFPGLVSGTTIDWFLPWPEEALVSVSRGLIKDFALECSAEVKERLIVHMGVVHRMVTEACDEYFLRTRRAVCQTPKSYLAFIQNFKQMYAAKLTELRVKEERVNLGLRKLTQGAEDVEAMKTVLAAEQRKLEVATLETNKMLASLEVSSAEAQREGDQVSTIKVQCEADAGRIAAEKAACEVDLAKAQPFVQEAETAISSIKPAHIGEIKKLPNPSDIIKLVFDGVLILFQKPLLPVKPAALQVAKKELPFFETSFKPYAINMLNDARFLQSLLDFGASGKDKINEETIEFLLPYVELEHFTSPVAKNASVAAEGLCTWVRAMKSYHEASKVVKPKLEALAVAQAQMDAANAALAAAETRLGACRARLQELQGMFEAQMAEKRRIEEGAVGLQRKMHQASQLIDGLAGERARWTEDAESFADMKRRLVGDCAVACAFVSYCGPFNQAFRKLLINDRFRTDCETRGVPVSHDLDEERLVGFLVDVGTVGDWALEGLPQDNLSVQNGILVTRSSRYPLLVDPQGQALGWIRARERANLPPWGVTTLNDPKFRDKLEHCLGEGKALVVVGVEEEVDPMLDPVLGRQWVAKGKKMFVEVSDKLMDYDPRFRLYLITRLANPNFSPELQAKTTVVDFTVTQHGLEEQLLGKVIAREQKALEEQLSQVLEEVNGNRKALLQLDAALLERLTANTGNLLEDDELVGVLANTKAKAAEVKAKLVAADETRANINEKREQYRRVAERGAVLYFSIVEMANVNWMYQTSLDQFLALFMESMDRADRAALTARRVQNIVETMTYSTWRYVNRGLYERDKLTFVLIVTLKILITARRLRPADLTLFLRAGAALDINTARKKPFPWMTNDAWLNVLALSQDHPAFRALPEEMIANEAAWRRWYEDNEPEQLPLPDNYDARLADGGSGGTAAVAATTPPPLTASGSLGGGGAGAITSTGSISTGTGSNNTAAPAAGPPSAGGSSSSDIAPFLKLLLVRALRVDRCILSCKDFVRQTPQVGPRYVEPVTDTIESIYQEMTAGVPVIFLLSIGADPTDAIETLARKKKLPPPAVISLGEGQEPVAIKAMTAAAQTGTWVLLQNCELGIPLMAQMEDLLTRLRDGGMDPGFRLFLTALPTTEFPLGLLQMGTKVTNEPPAGLKAGLLRSYSAIVDQDRLERVESLQWRQLLFGLCFLHSTVQERRKFGPLGWCVPYEYNNGDLTACILFLEKHLYAGTISWPTFQYMVAEVQYGGKITDNLDRRLFKAYTQVWLTPHTCTEGFSFNPQHPIMRGGGGTGADGGAGSGGDFQYRIGYQGTDIAEYRKYIAHFPEVDSPEIFGLHPNADLTFRVKEVNALFQTLGETQPKGNSGSGAAKVGGVSREEAVYEKARELLERLPEEYNEDDYKLKLQKLGGLGVPLNIFLLQEIQRLQRVIAKVKHTLQQLQLAIRGEVVMSEELAAALAAIHDARVPHAWVFTVAGDEFSWVLPTLGLWFSSLLQRDEQLRTWLNHGRPNSYWLPGFFNPQGLLTAMKQEVTRKHKADKWALDDVVYHTEATTFDRPDQIKAPPSEGIYVHGLSLEGAGWSKADGGCLAESEPKRLFVPLPVLYVTINTKAEQAKVRRDMFGAQGPYEAPLYKYPSRSDRFLVLLVTLKCPPDKGPTHWTLRGTALLCNTD